MLDTAIAKKPGRFKQDNLSPHGRVQNHNIKSSGHNARSAHFLIAEREQSIYDRCRFDIGRFRAEPTNYGVYTRVTHLRVAVPTIICSGEVT